MAETIQTRHEPAASGASLKTYGKKLARRFVKKPWHSDLMEFEQGIWQGVSPLYTESGRQLGEENTRPFIFNDHVPAKTLACKYEGSRAGRLINMSALKIAMQNYDPAVEITKAVIRHHAAKAVQAHGARAGGIWDLYLISLASIALIAYPVRRKPSMNKAALISDRLASQYQFIAGIFMICRDMADINSDFIARNEPISAQQLYDYADEHEIFTSFNGMVCAGSTKKIMDFLALCTLEMEAAFAEVRAWPEGKTQTQNDGESPLSGIVGQLDDWYRYAMLSVELDCFIKMARRQHRIEAREGDLSSLERSLATYEQIAGYCAALLPEGEKPMEQAFGAGALERQNLILAALNRKPVSQISAKMLEEQLGYE